MNKQLILKSFFILLCLLGLYAFQEDEKKPLTSEEAIEARVEEKIEKLKIKHYWECQSQALLKAIPVADSMIAEMYARDLRASDIILERPNRPNRPQVDIEPFPFDSIE